MTEHSPQSHPQAPLPSIASPTRGQRDRSANRQSAAWYVRIANIIAVGTPVAGVIAAIVLLWPFGVNLTALILMMVFYVLTGLGITVGYHRLFTHKSFDTGPVMTHIIGALGSMAVQGPVLNWAANHRNHHQHSDDEGDPHTPHAHGEGLWNMVKGFVHAHMGWLLWRPTKADFKRYVPDLQRDRVVRWVHRLFPLWMVVGLMLPALLAGLITMSWSGALLGFVWGGLVRVFLVHHLTWSVNSVCHIWGTRDYDSHDESRNNALFGVLAFGEGWHNNHHRFPTSARHGLRWWQIDTSYLVIRAMVLVGLARNVRVPAPDRLQAGRRR